MACKEHVVTYYSLILFTLPSMKCHKMPLSKGPCLLDFRMLPLSEQREPFRIHVVYILEYVPLYHA